MFLDGVPLGGSGGVVNLGDLPLDSLGRVTVHRGLVPVAYGGAAIGGAASRLLFDGGIRSGLDVLKAMASGAKACLIGRAWAFALGARGEAGVTHMLGIMRQELRMAMSLTGCTDVREAGRDLLAD